MRSIHETWHRLAGNVAWDLGRVLRRLRAFDLRVIAIAVIVALLVAVVSPGATSAQPTGDSVREMMGGWGASGALLVGGAASDVSGDLVSSTGGPIDGKNRSIVPLFGIDAELTGPALIDTAFHPAFFVHGGFALVLGNEQSILTEGTPGRIEIPIVDPNLDGIPDQRTPIDAVSGTGRRLVAQNEDIALFGGIGVAFLVPLDSERVLRIKPSIEYLREPIEGTATASAAETIDASPLCPCRSLALSGRTSKVFHSVGPGLEVELDFAVRESFVFGVFSSFSAYRILGTRSLEVDARGTFDDGSPASVKSRLKREPWQYRLSFGFRVHWRPR